jgi:hypothetical protein
MRRKRKGQDGGVEWKEQLSGITLLNEKQETLLYFRRSLERMKLTHWLHFGAFPLSFFGKLNTFWHMLCSKNKKLLEFP